jgi:hypothetical protein
MLKISSPYAYHGTFFYLQFEQAVFAELNFTFIAMFFAMFLSQCISNVFPNSFRYTLLSAYPGASVLQLHYNTYRDSGYQYLHHLILLPSIGPEI